ncbi:hypothetical protein I5415_07515 [Citrobacter sp. FDAARGOS_156]|uniref:hypothetical protein n=1 Tax=Citrobacter sp. FDAARGOS_156 TaxID=1702170 RepID=UPI001902143B|nr:hypothetical protein [Citrobacter sp. FDAARGOS_156]MBJ8888376.1 hypothetical protein [Citrobacter sp. FDAARGOS_156]
MRYCDLKHSLMRMKNSKLLLSPLLFLVLSGCDGSFFSSDVRKVTIAMDTPDLLEKPWFSVTYRSHKCQRTRRDGDFKKHYEDDSSVTTYEPEREKNTNIYSVTVPVEKGWYCDWNLSNVEFKLKYKKGSKILEGIDDTIFERITFVFDEHYPRATNGRTEPLPGRSRMINEEFYPYKRINHLIGSLVELSFTGRVYFYTYRLDNDIERILFRPIIHTDEMVILTDPLTLKHGEKVKLVYPDGYVEYGNPFPSFERLQKIRRERQQARN